MSTRHIVVLSLLLYGTSGCAGDSAVDWETVASPSPYVEFVLKNRSGIVDLLKVRSREKSSIVGLRVTDADVAEWARLAKELTNVLCLRVTWSAAHFPKGFFETIAQYHRLEFLHLQCRNVRAIPSRISVLTNLHLRYLCLDAPSASTLSREFYGIRTLQELMCVAGAVTVPDGISNLPELKRVTIHGKRGSPLRALPADLPKCAIRHLEIANVPGVETLLPGLPLSLAELRVLKCRMRAVPRAWLKAEGLQAVDLGNNEFAEFPVELLSMPSLELLGLDLNRIRAVPPITVAADRQLKISLTANPIADFPAENTPLVERGIIVK